MRSPRLCPPRSWPRPWPGALRPALLALLALILVPLSSGAFALTVTPIDVPGAFLTAALGINGHGQVVGVYTAGPDPDPLSSFATHGFLWDQGMFTPAVAWPRRWPRGQNGVPDECPSGHALAAVR